MVVGVGGRCGVLPVVARKLLNRRGHVVYVHPAFDIYCCLKERACQRGAHYHSKPDKGMTVPYEIIMKYSLGIAISINAGKYR